MFNDEETRDIFVDVLVEALKRPKMREELEKDPKAVFKLLGIKLKNDLNFVFAEKIPEKKKENAVYVKISGYDDMNLSLDDLAYVNGGAGTINSEILGCKSDAKIEIEGELSSVREKIKTFF